MGTMEVNSIQEVHGATINDVGFVFFTWNPDNTLQKKEVFADAAKTELIYRKTFFWNVDNTLNRWELFIQTTGKTITKRFTWNDENQLVSSDFAGVVP